METEQEEMEKKPLDLDWGTLFKDKGNGAPPEVVVVPKEELNQQVMEHVLGFTDHQLHEKIARLTSNISLASKLPDKGFKFRKSLKLYEEELERRKQSRQLKDSECEKSKQSRSSCSPGTIATMGRYNCYVVIKGRNAGIYSTWDDCKAQVDGYPNALYWGCHSEEEALEALLRNKGVKTSSSTRAILGKFKLLEVVQNSEAPCTSSATPMKFDDCNLIKNLVGLLLVALITLVVVLIAVVVKLFLM